MLYGVLLDYNEPMYDYRLQLSFSRFASLSLFPLLLPIPLFLYGSRRTDTMMLWVFIDIVTMTMWWRV